MINLVKSVNNWIRPVVFLIAGVGCFLTLANGQHNQIPKNKTEWKDTKSAVWPSPSSYINGIPVYEKFSDLEPIFHFNNDTTYIINFWATWCKPCVEELPFFETLSTEIGDSPIKIILCSLDFPNQLENKLVPFLEKRQLRSTVIVLLDGKFNNWIDKVSPEWSGTIPATLVYHKDKSRFIEAPFESKEDLEKIINSL